MKAYVINMLSAENRLKVCKRSLEAAGIDYVRIEAVDGRELDFPHPDFDERGYRLRQGRTRIPAELGCYLSHIKALKAFLDSSDEYGLILEDDANFEPGIKKLLEEAIKHGSQWDMLRLSRVNKGRAVRLIRLDDIHHLGLMFTREKGAGAYLVNRHAAEIMVRKFLPMNVPYDIMFDREWLFGYRTMAVYPFPISQKIFPSQIQYNIRDQYLPAWKRYWTVFPFRCAWETGRTVTRLWRMIGVLMYRIRYS